MGKRKGEIVDGVLLLDKPVDYSSNRALQAARRHLNAAKAGHTGTLDPFATGLLICCFGKGTKLCQHMLGADKRYLATLKWGSETDSGDLTGQVVQSSVPTVPVITPEALEHVLTQFRGPIEQIPPMYSALKRDGKKLYELARQGIEVDREARCVTIYALSVVETTAEGVVLDVHCSKGTYIRTLAQDIGRALGCFAHLTALRRTQVGPFSLDQAVRLSDFQASENPQNQLWELDQLPAGLAFTRTDDGSRFKPPQWGDEAQTVMNQQLNIESTSL